VELTDISEQVTQAGMRGDTRISLEKMLDYSQR
jgi:hypothetical protein